MNLELKFAYIVKMALILSIRKLISNVRNALSTLTNNKT